MSPRRWAWFVLMTGACGSLGVTDEGVGFLEVIQPASTSIVVGDTIQFTARALDRSGAEIEASIRWRTPDASIISLDENTGRVVGLIAGTGRVQAVTGTEGTNLERFITSDFFTVTVAAPPEPPEEPEEPEEPPAPAARSGTAGFSL